MKYIRTKDAIYEIIDETENSFELCGPFEKKMGCSCTMIKRLLGSNEKPTYRLANTIEELCDEFVYANKKKDIKCFCLLHQPITTIYYGAKLEDIETKKLINDKNVEIYGAIWTDKGLIYVAKLNDKGELELL